MSIYWSSSRVLLYGGPRPLDAGARFAPPESAGIQDERDSCVAFFAEWRVPVVDRALRVEHGVQCRGRQLPRAIVGVLPLAPIVGVLISLRHNASLVFLARVPTSESFPLAAGVGVQ